MKMKQTAILKFFTLLISTSFLGTSSFGGVPLCRKEIPATNKADQHPVTLKETLEMTYMKNADLDAARAGLRAQDENVAIANADWRPSLSVQGVQSFSQTYQSDPTARGHAFSTGYTATLSQNIYNGGGTDAAIGKAENDTFSQKAGLFTTEQKILLSAVQAHADVIANQDIVKYNQDNVSFHAKFLESAQARFEVGELGRTDVETVRAQYEDAKGDLSVAIGNLEASKATYVQIVSSSPDNLAYPNLLLELPESYEDVLEVACGNNPQITEARFAIEAAEYNVDLQVAELLPELDVQATVANDRRGGNAAEVSTHPKRTILTAQATLTVPIYLKGIPSARVRQAYQQLDQQKVSWVQTQRVVEQAAKTTWENHIAAREALKGYLAAVKAGELAVEGMTEEANVGAKTVVDVLQTRKDLVQAQIELVTAQESLITTAYGVLQAMGSLMALTLKLNVRYYDPDLYYEQYKDAWIQFWRTEDWRYVRGEPCDPICK